MGILLDEGEVTTGRGGARAPDRVVVIYVLREQADAPRIPALSRGTLAYHPRVPAAGAPSPSPRSHRPMSLSLSFAPLVSLIAGILILIVPRLLNYIVAIYLILIGLIGIFGIGNPRIV
jgi:hypothetical protein